MRLLAFAFTIVFVWTGPHCLSGEFEQTLGSVTCSLNYKGA